MKRIGCSGTGRGWPALVVLVAAIAVAALPGSALATPAWLVGTNLSRPGENAFQPQVAVDPAGDAVVVWTREDEEFSYHVIQAVDRPAGGVWQAPVDLSATGEDAAGPQIAVDPAGDAVAVWQRELGGQTIRAVTRPAGGAWSAPVELPAGGEVAADPHVAVDRAGDAVAVWDGHEGSQLVIQAASRPAGGAWKAPVDLSATGGNAEEPRVAVDPAGDAVAVWRRLEGSAWVMQAATRPAGGAWSAPVDLSPTGAGERAYEPQLAVDPEGDAVAVWHQYDGSYYVVQAASRPAGGAWGAPVALSATGKSANQPRVAMDPAGDATVVWGYYGISESVVQAVSRPAGGTWGAPIDLSTTGVDLEEARVAVDAAGDAMAIWDGYNGFEWLIQTASRPAGGAWTAPVNLAGAGAVGGSPEIAVDEAGDAAAVWRRFDGTARVIQTAGYDAAGPQLRSLSIPATGTVGQTLTFSVSPLDVWSAPGAVDWSFGDGADAVGTLVTHTYTAPGAYAVGIGATDTFGNGSDASGTVTITAAAGPAGTAGTAGTTAKGRARVAGLARVRHGRAWLRMSCPESSGCSGVAELSVVSKSRKQRVRRGAARVRIGKANFDVGSGKKKTVPIKLTKTGRSRLRAAGPKGLKARLGGTGVAATAVILKAAVHRHRD